MYRRMYFRSRSSSLKTIKLVTLAALMVKIKHKAINLSPMNEIDAHWSPKLLDIFNSESCRAQLVTVIALAQFRSLGRGKGKVVRSKCAEFEKCNGCVELRTFQSL